MSMLRFTQPPDAERNDRQGCAHSHTQRSTKQTRTARFHVVPGSMRRSPCRR